MSGPREERASLRRATRADISPVFAIAPDRWGGLGALLADALRRPVVAAGVDAAGDHHRLRVINEPASIAALQAALEAEPVYIADGHHRYESALADREQRAAATEAWTGDEPENFVLMGIVRAADPGLVVSATHPPGSLRPEAAQPRGDAAVPLSGRRGGRSERGTGSTLAPDAGGRRPCARPSALWGWRSRAAIS